MIMRSNKGIATLAQISLVMGVFTVGMMRAPAFAQTSQVGSASKSNRPRQWKNNGPKLTEPL